MIPDQQELKCSSSYLFTWRWERPDECPPVNRVYIYLGSGCHGSLRSLSGMFPAWWFPSKPIMCVAAAYWECCCRFEMSWFPGSKISCDDALVPCVFFVECKFHYAWKLTVIIITYRVLWLCCWLCYCCLSDRKLSSQDGGNAKQQQTRWRGCKTTTEKMAVMEKLLCIE